MDKLVVIKIMSDFFNDALLNRIMHLHFEKVVQNFVEESYTSHVLKAFLIWKDFDASTQDSLLKIIKRFRFDIREHMQQEV